MAITTASFAKALWPGINKWYGEAYAEWDTEYDKIFRVEGDNGAYVEDVGATGYGLAAVKPEGGQIPYDTQTQGFITRYAHVVYGLGFTITREMHEDDRYGIVGKKGANALAMSLRQTKETVSANVLNRGFDSSYKGGDGVELFSSVHPNVTGGTWSNELATPADLSESALEQACIDISGFTNDRGLKIRAMAERLILPKELVFEAERILKSVGRVSTADNDLNALKSMGKFNDVVINHWLDDTDAWFIRTNVPEGLKFFNRRAMEFGVDNDFDTENAKYKATERYSVGWTDPRGAFASEGA